MMRYLLSLCSIAVALSAGAGGIAMKTGEWQFILDPQNGNLENIFYRNERIFPEASRKLELDKQVIDRFELLRHSLEEGKLSLTLRSGEWQLEETIEFDARNCPGLIRRTARLLLKKGDPAGVAFGSYVATWKTGNRQEFYMPYAIAESPKPYGIIRKDADFYDLERPYWIRGKTGNQGKLNATGFGCDFLLLRNETGTALAILSDSRLEPSRLVLIAGKEANTVEMRVLSSGWIFPGRPQNNLGDFYCHVLPHTSFDTVIDKTIPAWYRLLGIHAPADRPDWVEGGRIYQFKPDAYDEENRFAWLEKTLFPRLKALGYNILYAQPVIPGWNPHYLPVQLETLTSRVGTAEEYRRFIARARSGGFRYWQDIVTHGSTAKENAARNMDLSMLTFNRDGKFSNRFLGDYMNPHYRAYLARCAEFLMKLGPDGFRVDMPYGNTPNWRKKGFPTAETPQNLAPQEKRWYQEWFARNGSMPELPYERASLCLRGGRLINPLLRSIVRKYRPDGAMLSELVEPVHGSWADVVYDLCWDYYGVYYCSTTPAMFVRDIQRFFHEQQKLSPPGTLWAHELQSHDLIDMYARLGTAAGNCAYALTVLCAGLSMTQEYADIGHGDFVARLNALHRIRPELIRGAADYRAVQCSAPEVWSVLRHDGKQCSIGLINFSNRPLTANLWIAPEKVSFLKRDSYAFVDLLDDSVILKGNAARLADFPVKLPPFGVRVIASCAPETGFGNVSSPVPAVPAAEPELRAFPDRYEVHTGNYSLAIGRKSGQLEWLKNREGNPLLEKTDLIFARNNMPEISVKAEKRPGAVAVTTTFSNAWGRVMLEYLCGKEKAEVRGTLSGTPGGEYTYWFLGAPARNSSWKANTFDGVMADRIYGEILPLPRHPYLGNNTHYRDNFYRVQWSSERNPLDPADASCGVYRQDGQGVLIRFPNGLKDVPPAMEFLKFSGLENRPGYAVYLQSPSPLLEGIARSFRMELIPAESKSFSEEHAMKPTVLNGVTLRSESTGAVISNAHYEVHLRRLGGMIRLLRDRKNGVRLIDRMSLYGRVPQYSASELFPHHDGQSGYLIREMDGRLYLRYASHYREPGRNSMFDQQLQGVHEYWFDAAPVFHAAYWVETPTHWNFSLSLQSTAETNKPQMSREKVVFPAKGSSVTVEGLGARDVQMDRVFFVATYFDEKNPLPQANRFHRNLTFRLNDAPATERAAAVYPANFVRPALDTSFEILGVAYSVRGEKMFPHMPTMLWESLGYRFHTGSGSPSSILWDPGDAAEGRVSMVLKGYDGYLSPCFKVALNERPAGRYRLTMAVKSRGNRREPNIEICLRGTSVNCPREYPFSRTAVPKESDWHDLSWEVTTTRDLTAAWLQVVNRDATGTVMFDNIRLEKLP